MLTKCLQSVIKRVFDYSHFFLKPRIFKRCFSFHLPPPSPTSPTTTSTFTNNLPPSPTSTMATHWPHPHHLPPSPPTMSTAHNHLHRNIIIVTPYITAHNHLLTNPNFATTETPTVTKNPTTTVATAIRNR
ncbi:hypothetical protein Hdeb2414_s0012g00391071 [Helianthus debilis subsp. tardiflorus]